ncbi:hypothetical protein ECDEC5A_2414 [Escherichia coli DEC5A]|nr:hypothetical protein ECDEC5A_2414 [Escherichia coli DEC5A]
MQRLGITYEAIEQHYDVPCVVYEPNIQRDQPVWGFLHKVRSSLKAD